MSQPGTTAVAAPASAPRRRVALPTAPEFVVEIGGMFRLGAQAVSRALRAPYSYGPEFVAQFRFALRLSLFPLVVTSFALSFGPAGIQASNFLGLFGALDRLGGLYVLIVVREFAPLVSGIVVAGVAGTAICADLGARVVREEVSALSVLGIDPVKSLVVPRLLALVLVCVLCDVLSLLSGLVGALAVIVQNDAPLGPFFSAFFSTATPLELGASFVKCALYGVAIALVSCYKGLHAKGGPEGVGRAVNQSVVVTFLAIGAIDYAFTQFLLATNPILSAVR
ncbi:ABC transporter permease [Patulibacter brassicae]|jgi:phospholipid/cholesterol/gamma-HCH transport system permease protein|uniref:ABC transporter permease n=1 Tax=Patulibacter brassicae TaxID=1705717 RepID=A0ABU4VN95_9ACTN|nr:ABC transporter permease [Patulibacter brassicae]MDX8153293.1 ABC transporter permease [Patulibacter brassicae]